MNQYAYRIYKNSLANPVIGGTVTAENMEDAIQSVIRRDGVEVVHENRHGVEYHYFTRNGSKVGILIYANPEDY